MTGWRRPLQGAAAWLALLVLVAWSALPIAFLAISSLKPASELLEVQALLPRHWDLGNYQRLLRDWPQFPRGLWNSVLVTAGTVVLALTVGAAAAYALSRTRGRAARSLRRLSLVFILLRMLPPIVISIPLFPLVREIGLFDHIATLILVYAALYVSLGIFIMKAFFDDIPTELEEAALMDGCTRLGAFLRVTLPLSKGGLVATGVFIGLDAWNEFLFALTFTSNAARTAPLVIGEMLGAVYEVDWGTVFAASTAQLAPVLIAVWIIQRQLIRGLTMGAVKG